MSSKNHLDVLIDGKVYKIAGFESEAYLQKVAAYINNMIADFKKNDNYRIQKTDVQNILLEINIANDYFKAKKQADIIQEEFDKKTNELFEIKHKLVISDSKVESLTGELESAKERIKELEKEVVRLQTRLGSDN